MLWIKLFFTHVLMMVLFYYYIISPIKTDLSNAHITEKQLLQELAEQKRIQALGKNNKINIYPITSIALINHVLNKTSTSELSIKEISPLKIQNHGNLINVFFNVEFSGDIFQLKKWLDQLSSDSYLININEIIVNKKSSIIKMNVFNIKNEMIKTNETFQWVGYKDFHSHIKGLLRFADGEIQEVAEGSTIHQIKILKITKEQMIVQEGDHKYIKDNSFHEV